MPPLDASLANVYSRAVLAIARADGGLAPEEGALLAALVETRSGHPVALADLLLAEPLEPGELAHLLRATGPFRGSGLHPGQVAELLVRDSVSVVLGKGHVSEAEARELLRFAMALGCTLDEVTAMSLHLVPLFAGLDAFRI